MPRLLKRSGAEDAFGHEIWDYFKEKKGREVIEREDGYIDPSEEAPALYFAPFSDWPDIEKRGIRYARGRVLDVGCGAGRVGIYLQDRKGLDVTGIDNSPLAVKVSKLRGLKKAKLIPFEEIDFPADSFDTVVMYGNNFGLFGGMRRAKRLLRRLHAMTSRRAAIICYSTDPHKTDNPAHLRYQKLNVRRGRMPGQIRFRARYLDYVGRWFDYLLVSPGEMREVVAGTGWKVARVIGRTESPHYVAILQKVGSLADPAATS